MNDQKLTKVITIYMVFKILIEELRATSHKHLATKQTCQLGRTQNICYINMRLMHSNEMQQVAINLVSQVLISL